MVNLTETLFVLAALGALVTLGLFIGRRRSQAKRVGLLTLVALALASALEVYLQLFT